MSKNLQELAQTLGQFCKANHLMLTTAESCTGGLVAELITAISGSSAWFDRGFVTYSNAAKQEMLGVQNHTLNQYGAVSEQTALAMASGALQHSHAQLAVAITGIAGPDGGTVEKPVGTVWFAWTKMQSDCQATLQQFTGDRTAIREQAAAFALETLIKLAST